MAKGAKSHTRSDMLANPMRDDARSMRSRWKVYGGTADGMERVTGRTC